DCPLPWALRPAGAFRGDHGGRRDGYRAACCPRSDLPEEDCSGSHCRGGEGMSMPAREPTIYDVARKAGVSVSTVSRSVNTPHLVQEETRRRVMRAVEQLKFVPKAEASALARKHVG